jgi:hypothetical protein
LESAVFQPEAGLGKGGDGAVEPDKIGHNVILGRKNACA